MPPTIEYNNIKNGELINNTSNKFNIFYIEDVKKLVANNIDYLKYFTNIPIINDYNNLDINFNNIDYLILIIKNKNILENIINSKDMIEVKFNLLKKSNRFNILMDIIISKANDNINTNIRKFFNIKGKSYTTEFKNFYDKYNDDFNYKMDTILMGLGIRNMFYNNYYIRKIPYTYCTTCDSFIALNALGPHVQTAKHSNLKKIKKNVDITDIEDFIVLLRNIIFNVNNIIIWEPMIKKLLKNHNITDIKSMISNILKNDYNLSLNLSLSMKNDYIKNLLNNNDNNDIL